MADKIQLIRAEIERLIANLGEQRDVLLEELLDFINSLPEESVNKVYTFKSIPRLLDMIQPTDRAKFYATKLAETLESEGYLFDATLVRESIKIMNGEKVAMATMDKEPISGNWERSIINKRNYESKNYKING